MKNKMNVELPQ